MKKIFSLLAIILLSAVAASAQAQMKVIHPDNQSRIEAKTTSANARVVREDNSRVIKLGPSTTYINNGFSIDEVLRVLGKPTSISERQDGELRLATYIFPRSEGRFLVAKFENGVLVFSATETTEDLARHEQPGT